MAEKTEQRQLPAETQGEDKKVLYHQLEQEELEEDEERRSIVRRNPTMELSIYDRKLFLACVAAVEVPGLAAVLMTIVWVTQYKGGVSWVMTDLGISFNWHPILMTISLIFLYGNGALIYRLIPARDETHKLKLKIGHAIIMLMVFCLMVIGLQAAFDSHNLKTPPIPNLYTLHSWVGLTAAILFGIQWALGFSAFLFPKFSPRIRSLLLPFHQYFGSAILALSVAAALMGHLEKAIWTLKGEYGKRVPEAMLVNFTGLMIIMFAIGVSFLLSKFSKDPKNRITGISIE